MGDRGLEPLTSCVSCCALARHNTQPYKATAASPNQTQNGYVESFNGKLRDELLNGEIFYTLLEAKVLIARAAGSSRPRRPAAA